MRHQRVGVGLEEPLAEALVHRGEEGLEAVRLEAGSGGEKRDLLLETLWQQYPSVLTANGTFWSVGYRACEWNEAMSPSCGFALVRSTAAGSRELGTTVADFGAGYEQATLARCGSAVCGMFSSAVIVWDDEGGAVRTILRSEIASDSERIVQVSGNHHGVYVVLERETVKRILFVPVQREVGGHNR